jgi:hypothetical protein
MKIRIKGNSLRYRLTKSEVTKLAREGYLEDRTQFINGELVYALQSSKDDILKADFKNNCITLYMPETMISAWANSDKVGFESDNGSLYLLIEKDFVCIDNVNEDQSDNYPNPLANKSC